MHPRQFSIALGFILCAGVAMAQTTSQPQPDAAQQPVSSSPLTSESAPPLVHQRTPNPARAAQHLGKQLGLTQDQVNQLEPIFADRQQQVAGVRSDSSLTRRARRAKLRSIQQESRSKIEALLTDTQKQQFEQLLQDRRSQRRQQPQAQ